MFANDVFGFRQHKAVTDVLECIDDDDNGNDYFLLFSRRSKTIATPRAKYGQVASHVRTGSATSTCSYDAWDIDLELVRTRFHWTTL
jgi:hypothetical protein